MKLRMLLVTIFGLVLHFQAFAETSFEQLLMNTSHQAVFNFVKENQSEFYLKDLRLRFPAMVLIGNVQGYFSPLGQVINPKNLTTRVVVAYLENEKGEKASFSCLAIYNFTNMATNNEKLDVEMSSCAAHKNEPLQTLLNGKTFSGSYPSK